MPADQGPKGPWTIWVCPECGCQQAGGRGGESHFHEPGRTCLNSGKTWVHKEVPVVPRSEYEELREALEWVITRNLNQAAPPGGVDGPALRHAVAALLGLSDLDPLPSGLVERLLMLTADGAARTNDVHTVLGKVAGARDGRRTP